MTKAKEAFFRETSCAKQDNKTQQFRLIELKFPHFLHREKVVPLDFLDPSFIAHSKFSNYTGHLWSSTSDLQ